MRSIHKHIANKIDQQASGCLLFPGDFRGLGSEDAIKMSLSRHVASGKLERLGHGVYIKSKKKGCTTWPTLEKIALAISKKERIRIKPAGAFALHKLGLTANEPDSIIYITDGKPRNVLIGEKRLVFRSATPKKLSLSTGISGLLVQALEELGKDSINETLKSQILKNLAMEKEEVLMSDLRLAPAWIYDLLYKLNKQIIR